MTTSLHPAPAKLSATRKALHRVAEDVLAPVRVQHTGNEIALQARAGGVATPDLPAGGWVGCSGAELIVVAAGAAERRTPLTSLRAAATDAGLADASRLADEPLAIDAEASAFLGSVFAFATAALEALAVDRGDRDAPVRLWPEHFDVAIELGDEAAGARAGYGVSPGDEHHDEPYAYVAPWAAPGGAAELWDATGFTGAELAWADIAAADDAAALLHEFWRRRAVALEGG